MSSASKYPATVREVLNERLKFNPAALRSVRALKRSRPWTGTTAEKRAKFAALITDLSAAYELQTPRLVFGDDDEGDSGGSTYSPGSQTVTLRGRLSVVSALHEFAHHRGMGERAACRWSINLFGRVFPEQFARCEHAGHMLRTPKRS